MSASERAATDGDSAGARHSLVYVGTYTGTGSRGIYVCRFDSATGQLTGPELAAETANPSFLAIHPSHRFLYAVGEVNDFRGRKSGAVSAFSIAPDTGRLTLMNQVASGGAGPCHIAVDRTGRVLLVANYVAGSVAAVSIQSDGRLAPPAVIHQHNGSSVNPARQEGPHAHCVRLTPDNRFVLAADLGLDKILIYRLEPANATLTPGNPPAATVARGSGPRHLAFDASGRFAYVITEMGNTIIALRYATDSGALAVIRTVPTLPDAYAGESYTSEIEVHPSGKYLYGSNRGHDSIAMFAVDEDTGTLTRIGIEASGGKWPRHFAIDPTGGWMLVGNERSDTITLFRIDADTGKLEPTGDAVPVSAPACLAFLPNR